MENRVEFIIPTLAFTEVKPLTPGTSGKPCVCTKNTNPGTPVSDVCENDCPDDYD